MDFKKGKKGAAIDEDCAAASPYMVGEYAGVQHGEGLANNRLLTESTNLLELYARVWTLSHLEKGVSLVEGHGSSHYVTIDVFEAFRHAHPSASSWKFYGPNDSYTQIIKLWTPTWFLVVTIDDTDEETGKDKVKITSYAHVKGTEPFKELLSHLKEDDAGSYARWFYRDVQRNICDTKMKLGGNLPHSSFYPDIDDLHAFYDEYAKSSANVLLLIGPPGTGKTTFLRGFLQHCNINAWVTYDPSIQQDESFSVMFADPSDEDGRVLILEDCDSLMESRTEGNDLMNRILNLSDGIIQLPKRKLIFSTNLPSLASVDEALLRPGRCFGAVRFRSLSPKEASHAAASVGLKRTFDAHVTLAQAINSTNGCEQVVKKIGF